MHPVKFLFLAFLPLIFMLQGCGSSNGPVPISFAFEGPPLAIAGSSGAEQFSGSMDRTLMVGTGKIELTSIAGGSTCAGEMSAIPDRRGRVKGYMTCSDGRYVFFTMRSLGSDQGFGVGQFARKVSGKKTPDEVMQDSGALPGGSMAPLALEPDAKTTKDELDKSPPASLATYGGLDDVAEDAAGAVFKPDGSAQLVFFYHPWAEEAARRLPAIQKDIDAVNAKIAAKKAKTKQ